MHRNDYAGAFDPSFQWQDLSRPTLGSLGREIMLCAMMHDRGLLPQVGRRYGPDAMTDVAVDEWMGASPIYNQRNRLLLGIEGDDVGSILKGLQLDIGAPHQFLDFQFELVDESRGYFWLPFCGAYSYVKAMAGSSDKPIFQLCHHMEDTTFDATVMAVNPYARCVSEHRPPLDFDHSGPVCRWRVEISDEHGAVEERTITETMRRSRAARFEHGPIAASSDGLRDYAGDFRPKFALEDLAQPVLARQCKEFALDLHLLVRAAYTSLLNRYGFPAMQEMARVHWAAMAPVYSARIRKALGIEGDGIEAVLKSLQVDPCFAPDYVRIGCDRIDARRGRFWVRECEALLEAEPRAFLGLLEEDDGDALEAVVCAVNPRARVTPIAPGSCPDADARLAFEIEIRHAAPERPPEPLSDLVRSNILDFRFRSGDRARSA